DAVLHFGHAIAEGEDFDAEEGRLVDNPAVAWLADDYCQVWHSIARLCHLDSLFGDHDDSPLLLVVAQITAEQLLQTAVIPFTHVPLQKYAVEVLAIRTV